MANIFLIEDDPLMVRMYEKAFKLSGYEVEMAFDGEGALAKLEAAKSKPTLILLDIMMPKLNGLEVLRRLKQDANLKNIPVIMLTNLAGEADAEKALGLGAVLYLVKSQYEPRQIVDKVKEIIGGYARKEDIPEVKVATKDIKDNKKPRK
ncbi:MAG: response regulator [Candidatus Portnoybacteria bacterium]|nr:response regulator [Candidatus Portnoybacteria bacterium]